MDHLFSIDVVRMCDLYMLCRLCVPCDELNDCALNVGL